MQVYEVYIYSYRAIILLLDNVVTLERKNCVEVIQISRAQCNDNELKQEPVPDFLSMLAIIL